MTTSFVANIAAASARLPAKFLGCCRPLLVSLCRAEPSEPVAVQQLQDSLISLSTDFTQQLSASQHKYGYKSFIRAAKIKESFLQIFYFIFSTTFFYFI